MVLESWCGNIPEMVALEDSRSVWTLNFSSSLEASLLETSEGEGMG